MVATPTFDVERSLFARGIRRLVALDEVGRGAIAGPVSVGAVVVDSSVGPPPAGLRDSKLLTPAARSRLAFPVTAWATSCAVGHASSAEIDQWGIMIALSLAARRALYDLSMEVDAVLLDGTIDYISGPEPRGLLGAGWDLAAGAGDVMLDPASVTTRAKADRDCASVAAASVLAKVARDALMVDLDAAHPQYHWAQNKGYGTGAHAEAIARFGPTAQHRMSWHLPGRAELS